MSDTATVDAEILPAGLDPKDAMTWFHENRVPKLKAALEAVAGASVEIGPLNLEYPYGSRVKVAWADLPNGALEFYLKPDYVHFRGGDGGRSTCKRISWQEGSWRSHTHKVGKSFDAILRRAKEARSMALTDAARDNSSTVVVDHAIKVLEGLGFKATLDNCRPGEAPRVGEAWVRPQIGVSLDEKGGATVLPENAQASVLASVPSALMGHPVVVTLNGWIVLGEPDFVVHHLQVPPSINLYGSGKKIVNPRP